MQRYRLRVGPDGQVAIPDSRPGQILVVTVEGASATDESDALTLATATTDEERDEVIERILESAGKLREIFKDDLPIDHGRELYGEDGLPR